MSDERRSADLVLSPNEYAYISDRTKGHINVYVGPHKTSLADTDQPVLFDEGTKQFSPVSLSTAIRTFQIAPEGWYIALKNPSKDGHPTKGTVADKADLEIGRKVNISGPTSFALYPGQMAKVIPGHNLKSNEYLLARIYDEVAAKENWQNAAIIEKGSADESSKASPAGFTVDSDKFTTGDLLIIKGTEVAFFIPPTGIEVLKDKNGNYIREAVTLELLEYCILLDQNGQKRYERGPKVVFPEPTEIFLSKKGQANDKKYNKFRAIELNQNSGIYIKVIADYEEDEKTFTKGDELFITGNDQKIYFPREEHAIVKYGDEEVHYGIAIPKGEARYVLNRDSGKISTERGPKIFLPDPRKEVIVRRVLDQKTCSVMFPGNTEALLHNNSLAAQFETDSDELLEGTSGEALQFNANAVGASAIVTRDASKNLRYRRRGHARGFGGDSFNRKNEYTKPRTITLDTKYEGAVTVEPWTGYAIMVVGKDGQRRVEVGPQTIILEYDEGLQVMELSTGKPKTDQQLISDVYLRTMNNKVSDRISAETKDFCQVDISVSYRVNFTGPKEKWFNVENYVKFLTDHMRSRIRNTVMRKGVEEFYRDSTDILRDAVLGARREQEDGSVSRPGMVFEENGMEVSDVEILEVTLADNNIQQLLISSQRDVINQTLRLDAEKRNLEFTKETEKINQQVHEAKAETRRKTSTIQVDEIKDRLTVDLSRIDAQSKTVAQENNSQLEAQEAITEIAQAQLERDRAAAEQLSLIKDKVIQQKLTELSAETQAIVAKATAVSPDLIAALEAFSNRDLIEKVAKSMGPIGILDLAGGKSVTDVLKQILEGTPIAKSLPSPSEKKSNGNGKHVS